MSFLDKLKKFYWDHLKMQWLTRVIHAVLGSATDFIASIQHFYFPSKYIRHWKADMLFGWYEKESTALFKSIIKPGMNVVDVGAHIGYYTRMYSRLVGPTGMVYAFEADPENFDFLKKNTAHLKNVKIFQVALTDHVGAIDFYESEEKTGCHSTVLGATEHQKKITVPGSDLDSILARENVTRVDVMKMDIEGGEPKAVVGMQKTLSENKNIILVTELSNSRLQAAGVQPYAYLQQLAGFGFKFSLIEFSGLIPLDPKPEKIPELFAHSDFINVYCSRV